MQARVLPVADTVSATVGAPLTLATLSINCEQPAGTVGVTVYPGGQSVSLADDGIGLDQAKLSKTSKRRS